MSMAAERYAKALLDLAISGGAVEGYQDDLEAVLRIYEAENGLRAFLLGPQNDPAAKKGMLTVLFGEMVPQNILHFLLLLLDKGRLESLPDIFSAYARMADEYRNILSISVTSALPLEKAQIDGIGKMFQAVYHASSVKIAVKTDESLIGGVKVAVGDQVYDGTVKGKLSKMQSALAGQ